MTRRAPLHHAEDDVASTGTMHYFEDDEGRIIWSSGGPAETGGPQSCRCGPRAEAAQVEIESKT